MSALLTPYGESPYTAIVDERGPSVPDPFAAPAVVAGSAASTVAAPIPSAHAVIQSRRSLMRPSWFGRSPDRTERR